VPGGKVIAKVIGAPFAFASSTRGLSCWGVLIPRASSSFLSVIPWPFRLSAKGMIIGVTGAPWSPIVEAYGMP